MAFDGIYEGRQVEDANGEPVSGAKIYFYKRNTLTLQAAYTDEALTTPASNPVIADSAGYYNVYLSPFLEYDIVIKSSDDATTYAGYARSGGGSGETSDAFIIVDTLSELQNLTGADTEDVVHMLGRASAGDGAEGVYYWVAGDQSSNVTTDEVTASAGNGGIWVAPSTDLTGASGAWKRANIDKVSVKWYGAVGDNTADDTDAVQAAIAGANSVSSKTVYFPAGTYKCDEQLILNSGARWIGDGPALSTIKFDSGLGNNIAIRTATTSGTINVFDQSNIELIGLHIQGFDAVLTTTASETHSPLIRFWKIDGLNIERCKFSGHRFIMCSLGGVVNAEIRGCEFADWGRTDDLASSGTLPANEGGAALWIAANPIDNTTSRNVSIHHNYFHDSQWSAAYLLGDHLDFSYNRVIDTMEGIYSRSTDSGTNSDSTQLTFIGNHIKGVTTRFIQASGFECGSKGAIISGNTIEDCEGPAIDLADTCETTIVSGNILTDCVTAAGFASYAAISIRSTTSTADVIDGITVTGNIIRGASSYYGIRLYRVSGSDSFSNIHVYGNDLVGSASSSNNYLTYDASQFGSNVALYQNQGASDYAVSATWSSTISASSGTLTTTSTPTARYWQDGPTVHFNITITLTDIGTGSGNLRFTLPTTPAYAGVCVGRNTANGKALTGTWGTTTTVNCTYYDATFPAISGHNICISGQYFVA